MINKLRTYARQVLALRITLLAEQFWLGQIRLLKYWFYVFYNLDQEFQRAMLAQLVARWVWMSEAPGLNLFRIFTKITS